jgi:hypothetical protein
MLLEIAEILEDHEVQPDSPVVRHFQKLERDHRIVAIFDGSTVVNRHALIAQFPILARSFAAGQVDATGLVSATGPARPPAPFAMDQLSLISRYGCSVVQSLPDAVSRIVTGAASAGLSHTTVGLVRHVGDLVEEVVQAVGEYRPHSRPPIEAFELAAAYEFGFAAAACMQLWLSDPEPRDGSALHAALAILCSRWEGTGAEDTVFDDLGRRQMSADCSRFRGIAGVGAP